jgi:hypothetical protein
MNVVGPIGVEINPDEQRFERAPALMDAIIDDHRFVPMHESGIYHDCPFDARFTYQNINNAGAFIRRVVDVEFKDLQDFYGSLQNLRLVDQVLRMQEIGAESIILVLANDTTIYDFAYQIAGAIDSMDREEQIRYRTFLWNRVRDCEAQCRGLGIDLLYYEEIPMKRLLSRVHKIIHGGSVRSFLPKPANGERQTLALSFLAAGLGPAKAEALLRHYGSIGELCLNLGQQGSGRFESTALPASCVEGVGPILIDRLASALWTFNESAEVRKIDLNEEKSS